MKAKITNMIDNLLKEEEISKVYKGMISSTHEKDGETLGFFQCYEKDLEKLKKESGGELSLGDRASHYASGIVSCGSNGAAVASMLIALVKNHDQLGFSEQEVEEIFPAMIQLTNAMSTAALIARMVSQHLSQDDTVPGDEWKNAKEDDGEKPWVAPKRGGLGGIPGLSDGPTGLN